MSGAYSVVVLEIPTEPTPGTTRNVRIQLGINSEDVALVETWIARLERQRLVTPLRIREWEQGTDDDPADPSISD